MVREDRLSKLKRNWGFDCNCSRCTQPRIFTDASDERLELIEELTEKLSDHSANRTATVGDAELLLSLYRQERLDGPIAEGYAHASLEENFVGNREGAMKYAALAVESGLLYGGPKDEDVESMRRLWQSPEEHWSWLYTSKEKT
jgi:hypothetical protein